MDIKLYLQNMAIFGAVSGDAVQYLIDRAPNRHFQANQPLFLEGDLASSMYVLLSGRVNVFRDWEGKRYLLREMAAGECVGEMSLLACSRRSASVVTKQELQALEISSSLLADLYSSFPEQYTILIMNLAREVCRRLEIADHRLFLLDRTIPTLATASLRKPQTEVVP